MRGHADAATLAAFREELLSARKAAQVSAHLAACPRCAALDAQLAEVTVMLNRATAPPMPDALTARIQAALAAEAAARTEAAAPHAATAPAAVPAMPAAAANGDGEAGGGSQATNGRRMGWRGHDRSWLALRVAAATAAVAVIAGGGYGVSQLLTGGPAVHGTSSGGGAAAAPNFKKVPGPGPRMSAGGIRSGPGSSGSGASGTTLAPLVMISGTNYRRATLGTQASTVLNQLAHGTRPVPLAPARSQARFSPYLQPCLIHLSNGRRPLLADLAHYQGHPALIVVLPSPNGGQPRVLVVAPGCTGTSAHIVKTTTLPAAG